MNNILKNIILASFAVVSIAACYDTDPGNPYPNPNTNDISGNNQQNTQLDYFVDEPFSKSLGIFTSISDVEDINFTFDSKYGAKVSGTVNKESKDATVWLVSSPLDLTSAEDGVCVTFSHAINYGSGDITLQHSALYSTEYTGDPNTTKWNDIPLSFANARSWDFVDVARNLPLEAISGNTVFAFKYISTTSNSSTWEIKNLIVKKGTTEETAVYKYGENIEPTPSNGSGDGTKDSPYDVAAALSMSASETNYWFKGYIVGYMPADNTKIASTVFSAEADVQTNIVIADSPDETDPSKCTAIQLPTGDIRTYANLKDNSDNYKKLAYFCGQPQKYCEANCGVKNPICFIINNKTYGEDPTSALLFESFMNGLGVFQNVSSNDIVFVSDSKYGAVVQGVSNDNKISSLVWLVSSPIDMSSASNGAYITFDHAMNFEDGNALLDHSVCFTTAYTGDPNTTEWKEIGFSCANTNSWTYTSTARNLPAEAISANTVFAFKYSSTEAIASKWEIKNFVVKLGSTTETTLYTYQESNVENNTGTQSKPLTTLEFRALAANTNAWVKGFIIGNAASKNGLNDLAVNNNNIVISLSADDASNPDNWVIVKIQKDYRSALGVKTNPNLIGKEVTLYGTVGTYYSTDGMMTTLKYAVIESVGTAPSK